ncbi:MAG: hypothetical protein NC833_01645 [Candidatus Omnitrophica bacterium]|nr:hypothetical protein [Candidatus Omnitrophota bacterium]
MKRLIKVFSIFLFFTSCYLNKNINGKRIFFERIENFSNQVNLTFILNQKIKERILEYPGLSITDIKENADYIVNLKILKFERIPLFYSKEADNIVGAKFEIGLKLDLKEKDKLIFDKNLFETISFSIYKEYNEEEILNKISERVAKKVYFEILKIKR